MVNNLSVKYYQKSKERLQKKKNARESYQNLSEEENEKSGNTAVDKITTFLNMKNN